MFKSTCQIVMATIALIGLASGARAQDVTSVTQPAGPGGTGATAIDTQYVNFGINSLVDVDLVFTKVAPISFSFDVDAAGGYTLHPDSGFNPAFTTGIVNDTGQTWTGFVFSVDTSLARGPMAWRSSMISPPAAALETARSTFPAGLWRPAARSTSSTGSARPRRWK